MLNQPIRRGGRMATKSGQKVIETENLHRQYVENQATYRATSTAERK